MKEKNNGDEQFGVKGIDKGQINNLLEIFQSAYKKGHSTETTLTRIVYVMIYLERSMTTLVSYFFFWTSQRSSTLLTTKYYSHDLFLAYSNHKLIDCNKYKIARLLKDTNR